MFTGLSHSLHNLKKYFTPEIPVLPVIVVEDFIAPFKFWRQGIHEGMLYRNDFYVVLQRFGSVERTQAHDRATQESNRGFKVCVTVSKTHYTVWVEMRSQVA